MNHPDLFGGETRISEKAFNRKPTILEAWATKTHYRISMDTAKSCKTCEHHTTIEMGKVYHKCERLGLTGSSASDIKTGHVCNLWEGRKNATD